VTIKATITTSRTLNALAADMMKSWQPSNLLSAPSRGAQEEIRSLEQHDYRQPLRRSLGRWEVRQIIAEAKRTVWPHLNDESVRLVSPSEFTRFWSGLGVQFRLAKLRGAEGLAILGFYVRKIGDSRLPLICVNTAHHPAAIGAAFSHEMGHHLTGRLFDSRKEHAQFLTYTAYEEHLDDPEELAADILVSLGVFPAAIARKILMQPEKKRSLKCLAEEPPDSISTSVLKYFEDRYGLSFDKPLASTKKLQYAAGLIHFAKLRRALLTEYEI
jgi:hypothetical protein